MHHMHRHYQEVVDGSVVNHLGGAGRVLHVPGLHGLDPKGDAMSHHVPRILQEVDDHQQHHALAAADSDDQGDGVAPPIRMRKRHR